jgi:hypothetical protein
MASPSLLRRKVIEKRRPAVARLINLKLVAGLYTRKFRWFARCVYCGMHATTLDHVFPVVIAARLEIRRPGVRATLGQGLNLVPACMSCNAIAGCYPFTSIRAKRDYIQGKLRTKLAKHLLMPDWSADDLAALDYRLRTHVLAGLRLQKQASMRCNWPLVRQDGSEALLSGKSARDVPHRLLRRS